jgi:hypothetical protein
MISLIGELCRDRDVVTLLNGVSLVSKFTIGDGATTLGSRSTPGCQAPRDCY